MKCYKYIRAQDIDKYDDWEIEKVIEGKDEETFDMVIISKEEKPTVDYIILNKSTNEEILNELKNRLGGE
jgi:hypothetical protein